jgi:hypothetical protein
MCDSRHSEMERAVFSQMKTPDRTMLTQFQMIASGRI